MPVFLAHVREHDALAIGKTIADASGLFNLMRNLGGAVGIAVLDIIIYSRMPEHARVRADRLAAGDFDTAKLLGIPPNRSAPPSSIPTIRPCWPDWSTDRPPYSPSTTRGPRRP